MYSLQNSNDYFTIFRSIVATAFTTTVLYIFTPFVAPELPLNRLQILYLFGTIATPLFIWRIIYIVFVFSPKYFKTVLIIGSAEEVLNLQKFIDERLPDDVNAVLCKNLLKSTAELKIN